MSEIEQQLLEGQRDIRNELKFLEDNMLSLQRLLFSALLSLSQDRRGRTARVNERYHGTE